MLRTLQRVPLRPTRSLCVMDELVGSKRFGGAGQLKILKRRRNTVVQIGKITTTLKTVASSKLPAANDKAEKARPFFTALNKGFETVESSLSHETASSQKVLAIVIYTDKGLCGSTNNAISRMLMKEDLGNTDVVVFGEKGCGAFTNGRHKHKVAFSAHPSLKQALSYGEISTVVSKALDKEDYDVIRIIFNQMTTAASAEITQIWLPSLKTLDGENARNFLMPYEMEATSTDELLANVNEFHVSAAINYAYTQNQAVELFSRRNSMENASKNAQDVNKKITLHYNKARQAMITTELSEIVSGAAAVSAQK